MDNELKSRKRFAMHLRWLLADRDWSQAYLAARTGISEPTISRYCNGTSAVSLHNLQKIANVLGCSIDALVEEWD